jgi:hypothetical protein
MARYFHSLGLYFPCQIGSAKVLLFKSGLHFAYDGPATPVKKLMVEIAQTVSLKLFITTGTAGAIGSDVLLGDVVVGGSVRFDCTSQFKNEPWHNASFTPSPLPSGTHNIKEADQQAAQIYAKYGGLTTAASVITTWAVIHTAATLKPAVTHNDSGFKLGRLSPVRDSHGATEDVEPLITAKEKR